MNFDHRPKVHAGGAAPDGFMPAIAKLEHGRPRALCTGLAGPELDLAITRGS